MTNLVAAGYATTQLIRRELEEAFDEFVVPARMRRDVARVLDQGASPMVLWRLMDQLLDEYMPPPALRRRVDKAFDRAIAYASSVNQSSWIGGQGAAYGRYAADAWAFAGHNETSFGTTSLDSAYNKASNLYAGTMFGSQPGSNAGSPFGGNVGSGLGSASAFGSNIGANIGSNFGINAGANLNATYGSNLSGTHASGTAVEVIENDNEVVVRAELMGATDNNVETRITDDNVLTIRAYRRDGVFTKTIALPRTVIGSAAQAAFHNGTAILEVRAPKADASRVRRVPVVREASEGTFRKTSINEQRLYVS